MRLQTMTLAAALLIALPVLSQDVKPAKKAAPKVDACQVLAAAQKRAKKQNKLLFVHLGAPW